MNKLKDFIANHRKKISLGLLISGICALGISQQIPEHVIGYADESNKSIIIYKMNPDGSINVDDMWSDNQVELDEQYINEIQESEQNEFVLDVTFITKEYDRNKPIEERIPVQGVRYKVYNEETRKLVGEGVTDKNGQFIVEKLPEGSYQWTQTFVPSKYKPKTQDGTVDGDLDYSYFSIHHTDEELIIYGGLQVKESTDDPIKDSDGNIVDGDGNKLDEDGNIIPEEEEDIPPNRPPLDKEDEIIPPVDVDTDIPIVDDKDDSQDDEIVDVDSDNGDIDDNDKKDEVVKDENNKDDDVVAPSKDKDVSPDKELDRVEDNNNEEKLDDNNDSKDIKNEDVSKESNSQKENDKVEDEKINPEDVQTYDKGVLGFVGLALIGLAGLVFLNKKKKEI